MYVTYKCVHCDVPQECIREALKEEMQHSEEMRKQALDLARTEMKAYVEEQRQVGTYVHTASIYPFLYLPL